MFALSYASYVLILRRYCLLVCLIWGEQPEGPSEDNLCTLDPNNNKIICTRRHKIPYGPNVSTTSITAMGCQQCLPLSVVQLKGKHNGVVDTFGHETSQLSCSTRFISPS